MNFRALLALLGGRQLRPANADQFYRAVSQAMPVPKGDINIGDMLTQYSPEEYAMMKMFLSPDQQAGYALKGGDELVSVFSVPGGRGQSIAEDAVLRGARRLDNYDVRGKLPELYGSVGFEETGRYPFNPEFAGDLSAGARALEPDYVEMAMNPRVAEELEGPNRVFVGQRGLRCSSSPVDEDFIDDFYIYVDDVMIARKTLAAIAALSESCK